MIGQLKRGVLRGYLLISGALAIWSTWGLVVRFLGKPAAVIVFYNALFALMFQGVVLLFAGRRKKLNLSAELGPVVLLGICALVNTLSFFYALRVTSIATALLTHYTAPVFVAVLAPLMLKDRMRRSTLAALCVSAAGLVLIFLRGLGVLDGMGLAGALSGTLSGVAYAFIIILCRGLSARHHPLKLSFLQGVVIVLALAPYVLPGGQMSLYPWQLGLLALSGLMHTTLANVMYITGIRGVTAQEAGVLGYLEPVLGITLGFIFLGETPHPAMVIGGGMILASGIAVVRAGGAVRPAPDEAGTKGGAQVLGGL
jgi:drug/metabolite transporter (DMT)-like permease